MFGCRKPDCSVHGRAQTDLGMLLAKVDNRPCLYNQCEAGFGYL